MRHMRPGAQAVADTATLTWLVLSPVCNVEPPPVTGSWQLTLLAVAPLLMQVEYAGIGLHVLHPKPSCTLIPSLPHPSPLTARCLLSLPPGSRCS